MAKRTTRKEVQDRLLSLLRGEQGDDEFNPNSLLKKFLEGAGGLDKFFALWWDTFNNTKSDHVRARMLVFGAELIRAKIASSPPAPEIDDDDLEIETLGPVLAEALRQIDGQETLHSAERSPDGLATPGSDGVQPAGDEGSAGAAGEPGDGAGAEVGP